MMRTSNHGTHLGKQTKWITTKAYLKLAFLIMYCTIKTIALRQSIVIRQFILAAILYIILIVIDVVS